MWLLSIGKSYISHLLWLVFILSEGVILKLSFYWYGHFSSMGVIWTYSLTQFCLILNLYNIISSCSFQFLYWYLLPDSLWGSFGLPSYPIYNTVMKRGNTNYKTPISHATNSMWLGQELIKTLLTMSSYSGSYSDSILPWNN